MTVARRRWWLLLCVWIGVAGLAHADIRTEDFDSLMSTADAAALGGDYGRAEALYGRAAEVSLGNRRAVNGQAWMRLRRGDTWGAVELFEGILAEAPDDLSATAGMRVLHTDPLGGGVWLSWHNYRDDLYKKDALGVLAGLEIPLAGPLSGAFYARRTVFSVNSPAEMGFGTTGTPTQMIQHDGWFRLGVGGPRYGLNGYLGLWGNDSGWNEDGSVYGVQAHLNRLLRWELSAVQTRYVDDGSRNQFEVRVSRPVWSKLRLQAGTSVQDAGDRARWSYSLRSTWAEPDWWASLIWRAGTQVRPVRLAEPSVYNIPQDIEGGWSVSGGYALAHRWRLSAEVEGQRFSRAPFPYWSATTRRFETWPAETSSLLLVTVGLSYYR